jgi:tellurite resistance protein TerC
LGRGLMLVLASFVVQNEWLQLVGALYLLKISVAELGAIHHEEKGSGEEDERVKKFEYRSFWSTVLMVELMDLAFSLDNVVVVVTLSKELWLIMLGVAMGIITMRFAAGIFSKLIEKVPTLSVGAYILVFNIGLEFIIARLFETEIPNYVRFGINIGILILAYVFNQFPVLGRIMKWPFRIAQYIMFGIDRIFWLAIYPFAWFFRQLGRLFGRKQAAVAAESSDLGQ